MIRNFVLAVSGLLAAPLLMGGAPAKAAVDARLDAVAKAYMPGGVFMGSVLVSKDGSTLLDKGYGYANIRRSIRNGPETQFRIGSLTKQFTAAAILLLQQEGRLSINDPVEKFVPGVPVEWRSVTLTQLLNHTSGIPDFTRDPGFLALNLGPHPWPEAFSHLRDKALSFTPGSRFDYSSTNYELLGLVIEMASGMSYGAFLRERLFAPLHMNSTGVGSDDLDLPDLAQGYALRRDGSLGPSKPAQLGTAWAAGSIYSTADDLLRWERGLFGKALLSRASIEAMTAAGLGGYGFGVSVERIDGLQIIEHGGAIEGFHSFLIYAPQRRITVAVLSNVEGPAADKMAEQLLSITLGHDNILPPISVRELERFVGAYNLKEAGFVITFRRDGDVLTSLSGNDVIPLLFEGNIGGKPTFFVPRLGAEITFAPDSNGAISSLVLHQNGRDLRGVRQ